MHSVNAFVCVCVYLCAYVCVCIYEFVEPLGIGGGRTSTQRNILHGPVRVRARAGRCANDREGDWQ